MKTNDWNCKLPTSKSVLKMSNFTESQSRHKKSFRVNMSKKKKMTKSV